MSESIKPCIFCSIVKENNPVHETVWSDEKHIAFLDANPVQEGHTLVIPKNHNDYIFDLSDDAFLDLMKAVKLVATRLKETIECKRIAIFVVGMSVPHTHVHLIPIHSESDLGTFHHASMTLEQFSETAKKIRA